MKNKEHKDCVLCEGSGTIYEGGEEKIIECPRCKGLGAEPEPPKGEHKFNEMEVGGGEIGSPIKESVFYPEPPKEPDAEFEKKMQELHKIANTINKIESLKPPKEDWRKELDKMFVLPDYHDPFTHQNFPTKLVSINAEFWKEKLSKFIESLLKSEYERGKADGIEEEATNCVKEGRRHIQVEKIRKEEREKIWKIVKPLILESLLLELKSKDDYPTPQKNKKNK